MKQKTIFLILFVIILMIFLIPTLFFIKIAMNVKGSTLKDKVKNCIEIDKAEGTAGCMKGLLDSCNNNQACIKELEKTIQDNL